MVYSEVGAKRCFLHFSSFLPSARFPFATDLHVMSSRWSIDDVAGTEKLIICAQQCSIDKLRLGHLRSCFVPIQTQRKKSTTLRKRTMTWRSHM